MTKIVSGEEFEQMKAERATGVSKATVLLPKATVGVVIAVLIAGAGFVSGMQYQKSQATTATGTPSATLKNGMGGPGGIANGQRPIMGTVTAVSADSITVRDSRSDESSTAQVSSSTAVQNGTETVAIDTIKIGDIVLIQMASNDAKTAARITLNPTMGGGMMGANSL